MSRRSRFAIRCPVLGTPHAVLAIRRALRCAILSVIVAAMTITSAARAGEELPVVYKADFDTGKLTGWTMTDKTAWKLVAAKGGKALGLIKRRSNYQPKVRSPHSIALVDAVVVTDFVLDVKLKSTKDTGAHRDLCLFFNYQDAAHFYYVHFGKRTDDHANQIFIVNGKPRKKISTKTTKGTAWTNNWHHARVVRDAKTGKIEVYFDDMKTPAMTAVDKRFTWGQVGIGSFDDVGNFDHVLIYGKRIKK